MNFESLSEVSFDAVVLLYGNKCGVKIEPLRFFSPPPAPSRPIGARSISSSPPPRPNSSAFRNERNQFGGENRNFYCYLGKHRMRFTKISCRHIKGQSHLLYITFIFPSRNENSFCEIEYDERKKKERERKSMTLFPYLWKGKRWGGKKKLNCESFDPLHLEYLNHCWYFLLLSFNISFFIDEELTFKTIAVYIYIYVYIRVSYNKYWTFSNSWLPPLPPSPQGNKVDEIRNFVTDRWWRHFFLTNIYYRLLFFLTNRHESLSFKRPSFSTYVLNSCSPECKIYTIEKLIISRISMGEKSW